MSIWYPQSGISYYDYMQANSLTKDITGQIKSSGSAFEAIVSEQTKEIVASNQQLMDNFSRGFDSVNSTLEWGFSNLRNVIENVNDSILSLHADFNYSMGLMLEQAHIQNGLLTDLLGKLDTIHKTLESPTLTQAREFYKIGCDRLARGLLGKALDSFTEAEKKNDTDFFTQFHMGKIYLYGINEDDSVLDLKKAKEHLLLAARYAKAEMVVDETFARYAAEALLHASISVYAQLGEKSREGADAAQGLLKEAKQLISESVRLYPQLSESNYHSAKYSSLLDEPQAAISSLETAITADRGYAVKVGIDHAFDSMRPQILTLLSRLRDDKKIESQRKYEEASHLLEGVSEWHLEDSDEYAAEYLTCRGALSRAREQISSHTYYGFLDAINIIDQLVIMLPELKSRRITELVNQVRQFINTANETKESCSRGIKNVANAIKEAERLILQAESSLNKVEYESIMSALSFAQKASFQASAASKMEKQGELDKERQKRRNIASKNNLVTWGLGGFFIGIFFAGAVGINPEYNFMRYTTVGLLGGVISAIIGAIIGQTKE